MVKKLTDEDVRKMAVQKHKSVKCYGIKRYALTCRVYTTWRVDGFPLCGFHRTAGDLSSCRALSDINPRLDEP